MAFVLEDDGYPGRGVVEEYMKQWSMVANPEHGLHTSRRVSWNTLLVMNYMVKVHTQTYLAGAFYFPCIFKGLHGVMLCVSNHASTALSKLNVNTSMQIVNNGIQRPEFLVYDSYFYNGLNFGNIRGFTDSLYEGHKAGTMEDVLEVLAVEAGITNWREMLHVQDGMLVYQGLRRLLNTLGIAVYAHVTSGLSWHKYAACDVYVSIHSPATDIDECKPAWWLVCDPAPYPWERYVPNQEDWFALYSWEAHGQRERQLTNDYQVDLRIPRGVQEVCRVFGVNAPAEFLGLPAAQQRRMMTLVRQAAPGMDMASMMDRRMFTMTNAAMYGLTRAPHEGKGKGKGKGILPIMGDRRRTNL
jgi:hypothetical protein